MPKIIPDFPSGLHDGGLKLHWIDLALNFPTGFKEVGPTPVRELKRRQVVNGRTAVTRNLNIPREIRSLHPFGMSLADLRQLAVPSSQKRMTRSQMRVPNGMVEMTGKEYVHHKEVSISNENNQASRPKELLDLPPEILTMIYKFALAYPNGVFLSTDEIIGTKFPRRRSLHCQDLSATKRDKAPAQRRNALLRTCRQVYHVAMDIPWMDVTYAQEFHFKDAETLHMCLGMLTREQRGLLQHIHLHHWPKTGAYDTGPSAFMALATAEPRLNLKSFTIDMRMREEQMLDLCHTFGYIGYIPSNEHLSQMGKYVHRDALRFFHAVATAHERDPSIHTSNIGPRIDALGLGINIFTASPRTNLPRSSNFAKRLPFDPDDVLTFNQLPPKQSFEGKTLQGLKIKVLCGYI